MVDMETRSCVNNLRLVGLPENCEGSDMCGFLESWLPDALELNPVRQPLVLERAHRVGPRRGTDASPRMVIMRFLNYKQKESVLRAAKTKKDILYKNIRVKLFADIATEVHRQRKQFYAVRGQLRKLGVRHGPDNSAFYKVPTEATHLESPGEPALHTCSAEFALHESPVEPALGEESPEFTRHVNPVVLTLHVSSVAFLPQEFSTESERVPAESSAGPSESSAKSMSESSSQVRRRRRRRRGIRLVRQAPVSVPRLLALPAPPLRLALPAPPLRLALPAPPLRLALPAPPLGIALPVPPLHITLPVLFKLRDAFPEPAYHPEVPPGNFLKAMEATLSWTSPEPAPPSSLPEPAPPWPPSRPAPPWPPSRPAPPWPPSRPAPPWSPTLHGPGPPFLCPGPVPLHGPGPPSLPQDRLRSAPRLDRFRSVWKPLLRGGVM
ncbi:hypothetical protein F2P79_007704 [Pimephales promelas]|nr:hypothetical protein F2P79_007704 [Pimephales promelas]